MGRHNVPVGIKEVLVGTKKGGECRFLPLLGLKFPRGNLNQTLDEERLKLQAIGEF